MRLQLALPDTAIIMVAGNHDAPRTAETGSILKLFQECGVQVIDGAAERITLPQFDASVLAVPDVAGHVRPVLAPDPSARYNVLLLHGEIEGTLPAAAASIERAGIEIPRADLRAREWDYIALGHYHVYQQVEPNAYYAGSIDYTSFNTWGERADEERLGIPGKGLIERDLTTGRHTFHPLEPSRVLADLPAVAGAGLGARELDAAVRAAVDAVPGGIQDKVVRLRAVDVPRHVAREMDHKALREYKRRALHFQFETIRPEIARQIAGGAPSRRPSLADVVREKLAARLLPGEIPRDAFVALGLKYLADADAMAAEVPAAALESAGMSAGDGRA